MEKNKKIIAALKKAFKKLYGKDDFFFILGAYTKDPDIFPKPAAELLEKIKADLMNELYLNITGWGDYYRNKLEVK